MRRVDVDDLPARPEVRSALRRFLSEATDRHGDRLGRVVLYGSVARGQAGEGSDVDLFVVWDGPEGEGLRSLGRITTRILLDTGVDVSVHPVSPGRLDRLRELNTSFYRNVEREGLLVAG